MRLIIYALLFGLVYGCTDADNEKLEELSLSKEEIRDLQFLKEEEKLARDVYLYAYDSYHQNIFKNISNSEQSHMNSVSLILQKYNIQDLSFDIQGKFHNQELQILYDDLTALADHSIADALKVGATIEDLDINDLDSFIGNANHEDIENMYKLLRCGSENHMRAFIQVLDNYAEIYVPQFISSEEYEAILESPNEKCNN